MIRIILPQHLQTLAQCQREISVPVDGVVTVRSVLDALEGNYPMLKGTLRDRDSLARRPRVRFFVETTDISNQDPETPLPDSLKDGREAFRIVGAVAGG